MQMPKRDVDIGLELFRTFLAVTEFRSNKKAAAYLGLSPPAISGHLRRLQIQLDAKLLDDSVPGVVLTPDGKVVLETARDIVDRHDQLIARISGSSSGATRLQPIKIGVPPELPSCLLVPALAELRKNHPELQFLIRRGSSSALLNGLQNGDLDICPIVTPNLPPNTERCHQGKIIWVCKQTEELPRRHPISIVAHPEGTVVRDLMLSSLETAKVPFRITFEAADIDGAIEAVRRGFGCIALPRSDLIEDLVERLDLPPVRPAFWGIQLRQSSPIIEQLADRLMTILP